MTYILFGCNHNDLGLIKNASIPYSHVRIISKDDIDVSFENKKFFLLALDTIGRI